MTAFNPRARDGRGAPPRRAWTRRLTGATVGLFAALVVPSIAAAHPLGNFTINHYAGLRVEPDRILLDIVIDQAEIPAFQARLTFDADGDGELSAAETEAGRTTACETLAPSLGLRVNAQPQALEVTEAGLTFPPGVGGLPTMRSVCVYVATLAHPVEAGDQIAFADHSFSQRLGWREIVVEGSGVTLAAEGAAGGLRTSTASSRLTVYPTDLLTQALADTAVAMLATPGGPILPVFEIPDAHPVAGSGDVAIVSSATVPGGVSASELPSVFQSADLTPLVLLLSIVTAAALGAGHALTPGHGKTLMAAYLVGSRGTPVHAAGLGLSVALSHTLGILALAGLVIGAQGVLPPDVVVRTAPMVAAISIVAIGGWMLFGEARRRLGERRATRTSDYHAHEHAHEHGHGHDEGHRHDHAPDDHPGPDRDHHAHDHQRGNETFEHDSLGAGEHSHGGLRHSHVPAPGSTISWRSLFVLGLAGGLIPSASALLILLGSIAAGRPAFGFILVVAFGLGMAIVMGGIGLALVIARGRLDRVEATSRLGRLNGYLPLLASFFVLSFGLYLTVQAVAGNTTF